MRIQHNIMAMNAYRNFGNNTSALSKNLEKLSSGYKINRAGDDAAGLAISEKMRAQITGLNAAQKNVKDGIALVKTAEGALQEVHDMLNRMDYLATQSANGTYDNEVDRANLQKEVKSLKSEIDRISKSANFNGQKLLNGELSTQDGATKVGTITANAAESAIQAQGGQKFSQMITIAAGTDSKKQVLSFKYLDENGQTQNKTIEFTAGNSITNTVNAAVAEMQKALGDSFVVSNDGDKIKVEAKNNGATEFQFLSASQTNDGAAATASVGNVTAGKDDVFTIDAATAVADVTKENFFVIDGQKFQILTRGKTAENGAKALYVDQSSGALTADSVAQIVEQLQDHGVNASVKAGDKTKIEIAKATGDTKTSGGMKLQIGDTSAEYEQLTVTIGNMSSASLGIGGLDISTPEGAHAAIDQIKAAINTVSSTRGDLGAIQNRLEHTQNNLSVMTENIQDAESTIRDTDVAEEMMAYTKNNILIQSAQAMLAQANQVPQGVLQLMQ